MLLHYADGSYRTLQDVPTMTYFGGILIGLYGLVCVVYVGAMAITGLLSTMYQDNRQQLHALKQLVEKQGKRLEELEKEVEILRKGHTDNEEAAAEKGPLIRQSELRPCVQKLEDHSSNISRNTMTLVNHTEILNKIIHHMHEQHKAIYWTRLEAEQNTQQLEPLQQVVEKLSDQVMSLTSYVDAVDESVTEVSFALRRTPRRDEEHVTELEGSLERMKEE